jgi:hypothetical protein
MIEEDEKALKKKKSSPEPKNGCSKEEKSFGYEAEDS